MSNLKINGLHLKYFSNIFCVFLATCNLINYVSGKNNLHDNKILTRLTTVELLKTFCNLKISGLPHIADELIVYLSQSGIHGTISFIWHPKNQIHIQTNITLPDNFDSSTYDWLIYEYPVRYNELSTKNRCSNLGKQILSLTEHIGELELPSSRETQWNFTLSYQGKHFFQF